jgi:hypothetical protein
VKCALARKRVSGFEPELNSTQSDVFWLEAAIGGTKSGEAKFALDRKNIIL